MFEAAGNLHLNRQSALGFKPQKESSESLYFPTLKSDDLLCAKVVNEIKTSLAESLLNGELKPGAVRYAQRLECYCATYGLKFSKEDHIILTDTLYNLVINPSIDIPALHTFVSTLLPLMKKQFLLSPGDLVLKWRPLFNVVKEIIFSDKISLPPGADMVLKAKMCILTRMSSAYFEEGSIKEIMDTLYPNLCPFMEEEMSESIELLEWFLPVVISENNTEELIQDCFLKLINIWEAFNNAPQWESPLMNFFSRLAYQNIGLIDWKPYYAVFYSRFVSAMKLPVSFKNIPRAKRVNRICPYAASRWIVATLGGDGSGQKCLTNMINSLETYIQPANKGPWVNHTTTLICALPESFVKRLYKERYRKPSWMRSIPVASQLSTEDVRIFVESILDVTITAVSSSPGFLDCRDCLRALHFLAVLLPEKVIPPVISKFYSTLDELSEPFKYISALNGLLAVSRPLVEGAKNPLDESKGFPEGRVRIFDILVAILPGIDINNAIKFISTLRILIAITSMVPLVNIIDTKKYHPGITEVEEEVCTESSKVEDFVLELFDRFFQYVTNQTSYSTRPDGATRKEDSESPEKHLLEKLLQVTVYNIICQLSPSIVETCLMKLKTFTLARTLDLIASGRLIASTCSVFSKVYPEATLKAFIPELCNRLTSFFDNNGQLLNESLENEVEYDLLILSKVADCETGSIIDYIPDINRVLDITLHCNLRQCSIYASRLLGNIFSALSKTSPIHRLSELDMQNHVPLEDWGLSTTIRNKGITWRVPGDLEFESAQLLYTHHVLPTLETLKSMAYGETDIERLELHRCLMIVSACLKCKSYLPLWDEPILELSDSSLTQTHFTLYSKPSTNELKGPNGENFRQYMVSILSTLQREMLLYHEDDTISLLEICEIWMDILLANKSETNHFLFFPMDKLNKMLTLLEDPLVKSKKFIRPVWLQRVLWAREMQLKKCDICMTKTHEDIIRNLITLGISNYLSVRIKAQSRLYLVIVGVRNSPKVVIPVICEHINKKEQKSTNIYKGALHTLLGPSNFPILALQNLQLNVLLWTTLIQMELFKETSLQILLECITLEMQRFYFGWNLKPEVSKECIGRAMKLKGLNKTPEEIQAAFHQSLEKIQEKHAITERDYNDLMEVLLSAISDDNLHWKYKKLVIIFIKQLATKNMRISVPLMSSVIGNLTHENVLIRQISLKCCYSIFKLLKRPRKKYDLSPNKVLKKDIVSDAYGERDENKLCKYRPFQETTTQEQWEELFFTKHFIGFSSWPKKIQMYGPYNEQPEREGMDIWEEEIFNFFINKENIKKLIDYMKIELEGTPKCFFKMNAEFFKFLFKTCGYQLFSPFVECLMPLIDDPQERSQVLAAEILAGIISGSKHWCFHEQNLIWQDLRNIIRETLMKFPNDKLNDWANFIIFITIKTHPSKLFWIYEMFSEELDFTLNENSIHLMGKLFTLENLMRRHEWQLEELNHKLWNKLKFRLTDQFEMISEAVAGVLGRIFAPDLDSKRVLPTMSPHVTDFITFILMRLELRIEEAVQSKKKTVGKFYNELFNDPRKPDDEKLVCVINHLNLNDFTRKDAISLLKTVAQWVTRSIVSSPFVHPGIYELLPYFCYMESQYNDIELSILFQKAISEMSKLIVLAQNFELILEPFRTCADSSFWMVRVCFLEFFQTFIFHNLAALCNEDLRILVVEIIFKLMEDERSEVRQKASEVLSGLVHCHLVGDIISILKKFENLCDCDPSLDARMKIQQRHSGVLGLCALVAANPYSLPSYLPRVFNSLSAQNHGDQIIKASVKLTMKNFLRTHSSDRNLIKDQLGEELLEVLEELNVAPMHYA